MVLLCGGVRQALSKTGHSVFFVVWKCFVSNITDTWDFGNAAAFEVQLHPYH